MDGVTYCNMGTWKSTATTTFKEFTFTDTYTFKYYKLSVYATTSNANAVAFSDIKLRYTLMATGNVLTPDNLNLVFQGDWNIRQAFRTFGHVFVGKTDATHNFDFVSTRLGILSSSMFGKNFEVYIDEKKVDSMQIENGDESLTYLCDALENGTHHVVIKCTGEASIDSIMVFH